MQLNILILLALMTPIHLMGQIQGTYVRINKTFGEVSISFFENNKFEYKSFYNAVYTEFRGNYKVNNKILVLDKIPDSIEMKSEVQLINSRKVNDDSIEVKICAFLMEPKQDDLDQTKIIFKDKNGLITGRSYFIKGICNLKLKKSLDSGTLHVQSVGLKDVSYSFTLDRNYDLRILLAPKPKLNESNKIGGCRFPSPLIDKFKFYPKEKPWRSSSIEPIKGIPLKRLGVYSDTQTSIKKINIANDSMNYVIVFNIRRNKNNYILLKANTEKRYFKYILQ